jgi:hypothetical protein
MRHRITTLVALAVAPALAACPDPTPVPCDVAAVLEDKCGVCHGDDPAFGAPMSLVSWEDFQEPSPSPRYDGAPSWEISQLRIHDEDDPMPPRGLPTLGAADLAVLDAWFDAGTPKGDGVCAK